MADSIAQAPLMTGNMETARWKTMASAVCAVAMGLLWLVAGGWKATHPYDFAALATQLKVPSTIALPFAALLATGELFGGVMLLIPALRRWGAMLTSLLLLGFMGYMGINYAELKGMDCSCFPILKRAVSPEFFYGDGLMLAATVLAGVWAVRSTNIKAAAMVAGAAVLFTGASVAYSVSQQTGTPAPETIMVDGKPYALSAGKFLIFFFDPQCMHCFHSAQEMSKYKWVGGPKVIVAPVRVPEFSKQFLTDTGLQAAGITSEAESLRKTFHITADAPNGVAIENGRVKQTFVAFDDNQPKTGLKELGWIE